MQYRIEYKVELATDGGAYQQVLSESVDGKTTSLYERTRRIDLPRATTGWLMRITRVTINQNNNKISDTMQIAGFTEVIDAKIRYPNTALLMQPVEPNLTQRMLNEFSLSPAMGITD